MSARQATPAISGATPSSGRAMPRPRAIDLFAGAAAGLWRKLQARGRRRRTERQLSALSDWQLKDIGMHRSQIWYLSARASRHPTRIPHADH